MTPTPLLAPAQALVAPASTFICSRPKLYSLQPNLYLLPGNLERSGPNGSHRELLKANSIFPSTLNPVNFGKETVNFPPRSQPSPDNLITLRTSHLSCYRSRDLLSAVFQACGGPKRPLPSRPPLQHPSPSEPNRTRKKLFFMLRRGKTRSITVNLPLDNSDDHASRAGLVRSGGLRGV